MTERDRDGGGEMHGEGEREGQRGEIWGDMVVRAYGQIKSDMVGQREICAGGGERAKELGAYNVTWNPSESLGARSSTWRDASSKSACGQTIHMRRQFLSGLVTSLQHFLSEYVSEGPAPTYSCILHCLITASAKTVPAEDEPYGRSPHVNPFPSHMSDWSGSLPKSHASICAGKPDRILGTG